jgi:hypothetical protein
MTETTPSSTSSETARTFLKSKYYPVDLRNRRIYNDPQARARDCELGSRKYHGEGTVSMKGSRLMERGTVYAKYELVPARTEPSKAYLEWAARDFQAWNYARPSDWQNADPQPPEEERYRTDY